MATSSGLRMKMLPEGDVAQAPPGSHVLLEAASGAVMHALRMPDGLLALRGGTVRVLQVLRSLPSAAIVEYPAPLGPSCDGERLQAVERAQGLQGLTCIEVSSRLCQAGGDPQRLNTGGEGLIAELLCSFCVTGVASCWQTMDAYRLAKTGCPTPSLLAPPLLLPSSPVPPVPPEQPAAVCAADPSGSPGDEAAGAVSPRWKLSDLADDGQPSSLKTTLQEKAIATAFHLGLRGNAARAAGAVAAVGCEGYAFYKEIVEHKEELDNRNISEGQYQDRVAESAVSSTGRAVGGLAGAAAGQAAIPVPIVGAVVGGVIGAACGGLHANSLVRGALRLSGGKARGGDDLVRCIDHTKDNSEGDEDAIFEVPKAIPQLAVPAVDARCAEPQWQPPQQKLQQQQQQQQEEEDMLL